MILWNICGRDLNEYLYVVDTIFSFDDESIVIWIQEMNVVFDHIYDKDSVILENHDVYVGYEFHGKYIGTIFVLTKDLMIIEFLSATNSYAF